MKNLGVLAGIVVVLLVFGAVSAGLVPNAPVIIQTSDPNGSVLQATPEQANQLFFFIVFVIINLVGAGATLALLFWFLGRSSSNARNIPNEPSQAMLRADKFLNRSRYAGSLPSSEQHDKLPENVS